MKFEHLGVYQDGIDKKFYLCIFDRDALFNQGPKRGVPECGFFSLSSRDCRTAYSQLSEPLYIGSLKYLGDRLAREKAGKQ